MHNIIDGRLKKSSHCLLGMRRYLFLLKDEASNITNWLEPIREPRKC